MSVQFRTRSTTSVDYSSFVTSNTDQTDGCCYVYSSQTNTVSKINSTISSCNSQNGYFVLNNCDNNIDITPSSIGCCCACSYYAEQNSYLKNATFCECKEKSGLWTLGECPTNQTDAVITQYCKSSPPENLDYREKRACCYPKFTIDGVESACEDLCSEKECADKAIFPYESTFYLNGRKCTERVGEADPVEGECGLSSTPTSVLNGCSNGTNTFCWNLQGYNRCSPKVEQDSRYPGKFVSAIDQYVIQLNQQANPNNFVFLTRADQPDSTYTAPIASGTVPSGIKKIEFGCNNLLTESLMDDVGRSNGYFAAIDENNQLIYFKTPQFLNSVDELGWPSYPISTENVQNILDVACADTFSVAIKSDNKIRVFGTFYSQQEKEHKNLNTSQLRLKKVLTHKIETEDFFRNLSTNGIKNKGFVGQSINNTFEYYSPFESTQISEFRTKVRSMPAKEYKELSLGAFTLCGIDNDNSLFCVSLNDELSIPSGSRYKLISCNNTNSFSSGNLTPADEYCCAIDVNNQIIPFSSEQNNYLFEDAPNFSITDIIDVSCRHASCSIVVEPNEQICNNQVLGSCCLCGVDNIVTCSQKTKQECEGLYGNFTSGGICCSENNTSNCTNCLEIENLCQGDQTGFFRSSQLESDLPSNKLEFYQDGLYVGIFQPGSPINEYGSELRGNLQTGKGINYTPTIFGYGTTQKKWAIIVASTDYSMESLYDISDFTEIIPGSIYDGVWNTYGDNNTYYGIQSKFMQKLRSNSRLSGWYLPSKHELEFINRRLNPNFMIPELFSPFKDGIYLTSTPYFEYQSDTVYNIDKQKFNGNSFNYGQNFDKLNYGYTYLVPRTHKVHIRLIRRIELE